MATVLGAEEALTRSVFDGATLMVGGFGLVGMPLTLVSALNAGPFRDLTIVRNNLAETGTFLGKTLRLGKIKPAIRHDRYPHPPRAGTPGPVQPAEPMHPPATHHAQY